jgi:hypothetical protein
VNPGTTADRPKRGESGVGTPISAAGEGHADSICKQEVTGSIPVGSIQQTAW